jgi:hypothetical protein
MPIPGVTSSSDNRQPGTPTIGAATAGNASVSVAFTAPANTGKPNTSLTYTATTTPGSITGTASSSPVTISGLSNGTSYTAVVKLNNTVQDSLNSAASNSFTPIAPPFFPSFAAPPFFPFFPFFPNFPPPTPAPTFSVAPSASSVTSSSITYSWTVDGAYSWEMINEGGTVFDFANDTGTESASRTGLSPNTSYTTTIKIYSGLNQTGSSTSASVTATTAGIPPFFPFFPFFPSFPAGSAPATPTGVSISSSGLVTWTNSPGADLYSIEYYLYTNSTGNVEMGPFSGSSYGDSFQVTYQSGFNWAKARVSASNGFGSSAYSAFTGIA